MTVILDISSNNMSLWCAAFHLELKKEQSWHTVEHWFNKAPMSWGNLFVILRVCYVKNLNLTNFQENNQNICYYWGLLYWFSMPSFCRSEQLLPITVMNIFFFNYCRYPYKAIVFSTELNIAMALETQERVNNTALNYCTHKFYPCWSVSHSASSHVDNYSLCSGIFCICASGLCLL